VYDLTISTAPTIEPIRLIEAKRHCRVRHNNDDTTFNALIAAATQACEERTHRQLMTASWTLTLDCFPYGSQGIFLPKGTFQSLDSLAWYTSKLAETTMTPASDCYEFGSADYKVITPVSSWPSTARKVVLVFTCGYGATRGTVPERLRQAMLILIEHYYGAGRQMTATGMQVNLIPETCEAIFRQYQLGNEYITPVMGTTSWAYAN